MPSRQSSGCRSVPCAAAQPLRSRGGRWPVTAWWHQRSPQQRQRAVNTNGPRVLPFHLREGKKKKKKRARSYQKGFGRIGAGMAADSKSRGLRLPPGRSLPGHLCWHGGHRPPGCNPRALGPAPGSCYRRDLCPSFLPAGSRVPGSVEQAGPPERATERGSGPSHQAAATCCGNEVFIKDQAGIQGQEGGGFAVRGASETGSCRVPEGRPPSLSSWFSGSKTNPLSPSCPQALPGQGSAFARGSVTSGPPSQPVPDVAINPTQGTQAQFLQKYPSLPKKKRL